VLAVYEVLMLAYGLRFKDLRFVDALLLGLGYTLRIVAGAVAVGVAVPAWLLLCSVPMFFGLALLKRLAELTTANSHGVVDGRVRAYGPGDNRRLVAVGLGAGLVAVAALAAYPLVEPVAQPSRGPVWVVSTLIGLWLLHMWRLAARGAIRDDPVLFALRDPASVAAGAAVLALLVFAS
jgi:4-hydroxybenzoate polyprenyltransferase